MGRMVSRLLKCSSASTAHHTLSIICLTILTTKNNTGILKRLDFYNTCVIVLETVQNKFMQPASHPSIPPQPSVNTRTSNTGASQVIPEHQLPYYNAPGYNLMVGAMVGKNIPVAHSPFAALVDANVNDSNGNTMSLHKVVYSYTSNMMKLPPSIKQMVITYLDVQKSAMAPLELPFTCDRDGGVAIEVLWGVKRMIAYEIPNVSMFYRFVEIPMESVLTDDPEIYVTTPISGI